MVVDKIAHAPPVGERPDPQGPAARCSARTDLSKEDRDRLDLHFTSIRDMEMNMRSDGRAGARSGGDRGGRRRRTPTTRNMEKVVRMQLDLIAFAFASDRVRTATLQVGGCNDHTRYMINGVEAPPYHLHLAPRDERRRRRRGHPERRRAAPPDRSHPRALLQAPARSPRGLHAARGRHAARLERQPVGQLGRRRPAAQRQRRAARARGRRAAAS